jgi:hypothetical protein
MAASGICPTNKLRLIKYMTVAMKLRLILMQVTLNTHRSPASRRSLSTVVVTEAKHTAEKIDSAIQTGKRFADMSRSKSISIRVAMMICYGCMLVFERWGIQEKRVLCSNCRYRYGNVGK